MKLRTHLVLRWLALVPIVAAVALARSPADDAGEAVAADLEPMLAANTVAVVAPVSDLAEIPALFAAVSVGAGPLDEDSNPPELIGIAGRLPDDVEVLLRMPEGGTRSIRIGESVGDWRLVSAAADQAVFSDDGRQIVLTFGPLP